MVHNLRIVCMLTDNWLFTSKVTVMDSLSVGSGLTGAQKDELMDQVKQQIAVANAQELLSVGKTPGMYYCT